MINKLHPYVICALIVLVGVLMVASVWTVTNKFIAAPVGVVGAILIIVGLQMTANVAEAIERQKNPEYDKPVEINSTTEKVLHYFGYASAVSCFGAFMLAGRFFDNTIGGTSFFFVCAIPGVILSVIYYYCLKRFYRGFIKKNEDRQRSIFFSCLAIVAWTALGLAYYNVRSIRTGKLLHTIVDYKSQSVRRTSPYLFLVVNGKSERFSPAYNEWYQLHAGDSVVLETGMGALGYEYVFHFTPIK